MIITGAEGFEPSGRSSRPTVFKTVALNRSAKHPNIIGPIGFEPMNRGV